MGAKRSSLNDALAPSEQGRALERPSSPQRRTAIPWRFLDLTEELEYLLYTVGSYPCRNLFASGKLGWA